MTRTFNTAAQNKIAPDRMNSLYSQAQRINEAKRQKKKGQISEMDFEKTIDAIDTEMKEFPLSEKDVVKSLAQVLAESDSLKLELNGALDELVQNYK